MDDVVEKIVGNLPEGIVEEVVGEAADAVEAAAQAAMDALAGKKGINVKTYINKLYIKYKKFKSRAHKWAEIPPRRTRAQKLVEVPTYSNYLLKLNFFRRKRQRNQDSPADWEVCTHQYSSAKRL
jgi:hypothetical protein